MKKLNNNTVKEIIIYILGTVILTIALYLIVSYACYYVIDVKRESTIKVIEGLSNEHFDFKFYLSYSFNLLFYFFLIISIIYNALLLGIRKLISKIK